MDDALTKKARTMADRGTAILEACAELGNWPQVLAGTDFTSDDMTPLALLSPNSRVEEGLGMMGITYQEAHDSLLVRRGDIPDALATEIWRTIAGEHQLAGART